MTLQPGRRLGPYEVVAALGAGGMGEVYRARDTRLDRIVAVKVMPTSLSGDPELKQRLAREARANDTSTRPSSSRLAWCSSSRALLTCRWKRMFRLKWYRDTKLPEGAPRVN